MTHNEIEVPKEVREFMLEGAEETNLGQKNGAEKQYRYGNLHIREYADKFTVHMDKVDPRKDPFGHLLNDAPEILFGLMTGTIGGTSLAASLIKHKKPASFVGVSGVLSSIALGYLGYTISKKIKDRS